MRRQVCVVVLLCLCCCAPKTPVERAFFHWKRILAYDDADRELLGKLGVTRLFVRYFDIVREEGRTTITPPLSVHSVPGGLEIVPIVFITPRVMQETAEGELPALAGRLWGAVGRMNADFGFPSPREVQIDCDWRPSFRDRFFAFLKALKSSPAAPEGVVLSVTLRLHQLADTVGAGIPPVARGMVMPYNLLPVHVFDSRDSIVDPKVLRVYIDRSACYPLPLDMALPAFAWAAHFNPDDRFIGLIRDVREDDVESDPALRHVEGRLYEARTNTRLRRTRVLAGDKVRADGVSCRELLPIARRLARRRADYSTNAGLTVSIFHYDREMLEGFTGGRPGDVEKLYRVFE